jgi:cell division GTPase FtsZ
MDGFPGGSTAASFWPSRGRIAVRFALPRRTAYPGLKDMSEDRFQVIDEAAALALGRALHIGVVGLGQCGGNIADAFAVRGYPAIAVNCASADLAALKHVPPPWRLGVGAAAANGSGGSLRLGGEALRAGGDLVAELVEQVFDDVEIVLAVGGLGGGTGGNLVELVSIVAELEFPVIAMGVLPGLAEGYRVKTNALWAINELVDAPIDSLLLVDNEKLYAKHGSATVETFWSACNESLVAAIDGLNCLASDESLTSVRTFDPNDLRQLVRFGGTTQFGTSTIKGGICRDSLLNAFMDAINNNDMLATGIEFEDIVVLGSIVTAGTEILSQTSAAVFDDYFREVQLVTNGAAHRFGLYRRSTAGPAQLHVIAAGLPLPGRVHDMLAEATAEAQRFGTKKSQARIRLQRLDLSPLGVQQEPSPPTVSDTRPPPRPPVVAIEEAAPMADSEERAGAGVFTSDAPALDDAELAGEQDADVIEGLLGPPSRVLSDEP